MEFTVDFSRISDSFESRNIAITHIRSAFYLALAIFFIIYSSLMVKHCRSHQPVFSFDASVITARIINKFLRFVTMTHLVLIAILFYCYFTFGRPIEHHAAFSYQYKGDSWIYGFARPSFGLIFVSMGMFADMHPATRIICIVAALIQALCDALSAYQISDQINQVRDYNAPTNGYSIRSLHVYYWRDVIGFFTNTMILLLCSYLTCLLGFCEPQLIHPSLISDRQEINRFDVMNRSRVKRKYMEKVGIVEMPYIAKYHRHISDFDLSNRNKDDAHNSNHPVTNNSSRKAELGDGMLGIGRNRELQDLESAKSDIDEDGGFHQQYNDDDEKSDEDGVEDDDNYRTSLSTMFGRWRNALNDPQFRSTLGGIFFSCTTVGIATNFFGTFTLCVGPSMMPTIKKEGEIVFVNLMQIKVQGDYTFQRGDIVIATCPTDPNKRICKRIIGLPGDAIIDIQDASRSMGIPRPYKVIRHVPIGHVWLQGDNKLNSIDSRTYGPVPMALIQGRAIFKFKRTPYFIEFFSREIPFDEEEDNAATNKPLLQSQRYEKRQNYVERIPRTVDPSIKTMQENRTTDGQTSTTEVAGTSQVTQVNQ